MTMRRQESAAEFWALLQAVPYALVVTDSDRRIVFVNSRAESMSGYAREEVLQQCVELFVPDRHRTALAAYWDSCVTARQASPRPTDSATWYGRCKSGREFPLELLLSPVDTADGLLVLAMLHDVTARSQLEESLRQRALLIELSYEPILVWDLERGIVLWNRGCEQLYGFTRAEAIGRVSHQLLHTVFPESFAQFHATLWRERQWSGELRHTTHDGRQVLVESRHQLVASDGRWLVLETNRDITARKQVEESLQRSHTELEHRVQERTAALMQMNEMLRAEVSARQQAEKGQQQLLTRLASVQEEERRRLSHELHDQLGQELHALMLGLKTLEVYVQESPTARQHVKQLQTLTAGIGQEMHRLAWALRPPDLDDEGVETVLQGYVEEWSQRCGIPVDFHSRGFTGQRLPSYLETTLYRIVQEACTNILRHARAQSISVLIERRRGHVLAIVEDDGVGFDVEAVLGARQAQGRLGVVGMQERAALVGGSIEIESAMGAGTTVFVRLPIPQDGDGRTLSDAAAPRREVSS